MKVFVSYTTRDSYITKEYLESIDEVVSEYANSFIDLLHNTNNDKQEFVKQELLSSDVVLLISSKSILLSPWVHWELSQAQNKGILVINIPVNKIKLSNSLEEIRIALSNKFTTVSKNKTAVDCLES